MEIDEARSRATLYLPLEFTLGEGRPLAISLAAARCFKLEDGLELAVTRRVRVLHRPSDDGEIKDGVFVRVPKNLLYFRLDLALPADRASRLGPEDFTVVLVLEFNDENRMTFEVSGTLDWAQSHLEIRSVRRTDRPGRILVNLGLLVTLLGVLHVWNNHIASGAFPESDWVVSPATLNVVTSFLVGFLGLQVASLILVARQLPGLQAIANYPELFLAKPLTGLLLHRAVTPVLGAALVGGLAYAALNWTVPLRGELGPDYGLFTVGPGAGFIKREAKITTPRRVKLSSLGDLRIACIAKDPDRDVPPLGALRLLQPSSWAPWTWSLEPDYWPFTLKVGGSAASESLITALELRSPKPQPHLDAVAARLCGREEGSFTVDFDLSQEGRTIDVRPGKLFEPEDLQVLFIWVTELSETKGLSTLLDASEETLRELTEKFQQSLGKDSDRLLPRETFVARLHDLLIGNERLGDPLRNGLASVEVKRAVAEIQVLRAYLRLIRVYGGEHLSTEDIGLILDQSSLAFLQAPGIRGLDKNVILAHLVLLLELEKQFPGESEAASVQARLEDLVDRSGAEYYAVLLEAHARTATLLSPQLAPATREARKSFFRDPDRRGLVATSEEAQARIQRLIENSKDPLERRYLESVLGQAGSAPRQGPIAP